jgi:heavy metal sensor kinase
MYLLLQQYLLNQIDDNLKVHSAQVHGTLDPEEIPHPLDYEVIHSKLPPVNEFASPGIYIQLIEKNGEVVVKSNSLGDQELPVNPSLIARGFNGEVAIETVSAGDGVSIRMIVSPLYLQDQVLVLEVAQSMNHVANTMNQVRWALLISTLVALFLAVASGWILVRSTLSPVRKISRTAATIETGSDLKQQIGYSGPDDEIGELASTFDHMIEHLDKVFQSQRYFVADASHELRGPLTVIRGNLELLKRPMSEEDHKESLQAIERESARMSRIVDDLLLLAEVESGQTTQQQKVSLRKILSEEVERARSSAGKRKITIEKQEDLFIMGDTQSLKQLLSNLLNNAIKYTPDDGIITVSLFRDGDYGFLEVTDNGIGIEPEHLPHIFDRFYRIDKARSRASGSTGLGLALVKSIAEQHAGSVVATSKPGEGTTFTFRFKL